MPVAHDQIVKENIIIPKDIDHHYGTWVPGSNEENKRKVKRNTDTDSRDHAN
jgi:hypothetical protein